MSGSAPARRQNRKAQMMCVRDALLPDAEAIHRLISAYSTDGTLLPRTLAEICENVRDFVVLEHDQQDHWLRRFASIRAAPGRDPVDHGGNKLAKLGRRPPADRCAARSRLRSTT